MMSPARNLRIFNKSFAEMFKNVGQVWNLLANLDMTDEMIKISV